MGLTSSASSIYSRAMILIGTSLALVTILLTFTTVYERNMVLTRELQSRVAALAEQQAVSVSSALWNLNREAAEVVLRGVARDPDFLAATVLDDKGRAFAQAGAVHLGERQVARSEAPIAFEDGGNLQIIGSLTLAFSLQRLEREQRDSLWWALILGLLQLVAVLLATALALRAVTRPLETITGRMLEIARGEQLDGMVPYMERRDQIGNIARAVGSFRTETLKRQRAEEALRLAHDDLDRRVQERTRELSERDARLQGIMDNVSDGIVTIDEKSIIESANRSAGQTFGYGEEELIGRNMDVLIPNPDGGQRDSYIADGQTARGKVAGLGPREVTGWYKEGKAIPLELAINEMRIGGVRKFIGVFREISERKESEQRLQQAQKMETVGHLTGGIAHDFNNLLTVILCNLELLGGKVEDGQAENWLRSASWAAKRGAGLTRRLLAFSRQQPLNPQVVDMNSVVYGMDNMLRRALGESIDFQTVLADGLWRTEIDSHQLESAVLNLAVNARDAMPNGGCLTIETANVCLDASYIVKHDSVEAGEYVVAAVSDTGLGMAPEVQNRAFEPFFTTKEPGKGTGLGLSMIYGFAKQSRGHVELHSEEGHGTTVKLFFPRTRRMETQVIGTASKGGIATGTETILVVEDEAEVRNIAVTFLEGLGYRVIPTSDGTAALLALQAHPEVSLLFTDVIMPGGINGFSLARKVRARMSAVKVLYVSGYLQEAMEHSAQLGERAEFIWKPYDLATVAQKVRQVLDS